MENNINNGANNGMNTEKPAVNPKPENIPVQNRPPMGNSVNPTQNRPPMGNPVNPTQSRPPMGNPVNPTQNRPPMGNQMNPTQNRPPMGNPVNPTLNRPVVMNSANPVPKPTTVAPSAENSAPVNNEQSVQNNQGTSYMPYGSYLKPVQDDKKKEKGRRKGKIFAIVSLSFAFIFAVGVLVISLFPGEEPEEEPLTNGDGIELPLVEPPMKAEDVQSAGDVYKKVKDSSVGILVYINNQQTVYSEGTGVVMIPDNEKAVTYIVTCAHVIDAKNPRVIVQTDDGTQYDAKVVGMDAKTDIGVLVVSTTDLQPAEFANTDDIQVGDAVYAIGNPGGVQFFGSFTNGIVSAIARPINSPVNYEVACIQHSAPINPGNSGGALVNEFGQVIGINSSKIAATEFEGMGFAVPSNMVKEVVDEIIKNGYVSNRPVLGVTFIPATQNQTYSIVVKANNLPAGSVIIEDIMVGSDLANSEVKSGDMIISVNGNDLDSYEVLLEAIENGKIGDTIKLGICRIDANYNISTFEVEVKLVADVSTSTSKSEPMENDSIFPFGD